MCLVSYGNENFQQLLVSFKKIQGENILTSPYIFKKFLNIQIYIKTIPFVIKSHSVRILAIWVARASNLNHFAKKT